jgi:hypothetical protein
LPVFVRDKAGNIQYDKDGYPELRRLIVNGSAYADLTKDILNLKVGSQGIGGRISLQYRPSNNNHLSFYADADSGKRNVFEAAQGSNIGLGAIYEFQNPVKLSENGQVLLDEKTGEPLLVLNKTALTAGISIVQNGKRTISLSSKKDQLGNEPALVVGLEHRQRLTRREAKTAIDLIGRLEGVQGLQTGASNAGIIGRLEITGCKGLGGFLEGAVDVHGDTNAQLGIAYLLGRNNCKKPKPVAAASATQRMDEKTTEYLDNYVLLNPVAGERLNAGGIPSRTQKPTDGHTPLLTTTGISRVTSQQLRPNHVEYNIVTSVGIPGIPAVRLQFTDQKALSRQEVIERIQETQRHVIRTFNEVGAIPRHDQRFQPYLEQINAEPELAKLPDGKKFDLARRGMMVAKLLNQGMEVTDVPADAVKLAELQMKDLLATGSSTIERAPESEGLTFFIPYGESSSGVTVAPGAVKIEAPKQFPVIDRIRQSQQAKPLSPEDARTVRGSEAVRALQGVQAVGYETKKPPVKQNRAPSDVQPANAEPTQQGAMQEMLQRLRRFFTSDDKN